MSFMWHLSCLAGDSRPTPQYKECPLPPDLRRKGSFPATLTIAAGITKTGNNVLSG